MNNVNSIKEKLKSTFRVHIIPIGIETIHRVVLPAKYAKADKIYLVAMPEKKDNWFISLLKKIFRL